MEKNIFYDNNDIDIKHDLNNGQIYLIRNKINNKSYVGQANCFMGLDNRKWGTNGRWKSHIREALKTTNDHCLVLNNAIRKYGENSFDIFTLIKCPIDKLDNYEIEFIKLYNTVQPNGYNIKEGGSKSKNTTEIIEKMKKAHLGLRREKYNRTHKEDEDLPKYIRCHRIYGIKSAYVINKFPIGIDKTEYVKDIYFYANKSRTIDEALIEAIQKLEELKKEYKYINEDIFKEKSVIKPKVTQEEKREEIFKDKLPEFIYPILDNLKLKGYYVDGILDLNGNPYPKKEFIEKTNRWNLNSAKLYIEQMKYYTDNNIDISKIENFDVLYRSNKSMDEKFYLPTYVNKYTKKGDFLGFMINGYPFSKFKSGKYKKEFADTDLSMEENYKNCIEYLEKLKKEYPIEEEKKKLKELNKNNKITVV